MTGELKLSDPKSKEYVTGELKWATPPPSRVPDVGKDVKGEKSEMDVTGELQPGDPKSKEDVRIRILLKLFKPVLY